MPNEKSRMAVVKRIQLPANFMTRDSQMTRTNSGRNINRSRTAPMTDVS